MEVRSRGDRHGGTTASAFQRGEWPGRESSQHQLAAPGELAWSSSRTLASMTR